MSSTRQSEQERLDLLQGTIDLLILHMLRPGQAHGRAIAGTIEQRLDEGRLAFGLAVAMLGLGR